MNPGGAQTVTDAAARSPPPVVSDRYNPSQPLGDGTNSMRAGQRRRQSPQRSGYPLSTRARLSPVLKLTASRFNIR